MRGTVYAAVTGEPFLTAAKQSGLQVAMPVYSSVLPGAPQLVYVSTRKYVSDHSSIVKGFADSIAEANTALSRDPAELKKVAITSTNSTSSVINSIILPVFTPPTVQIATLIDMEQLMVRYGVLTNAFDPTPNIFAG
jgi:ABC-type nitrate/sulfonate/bicarbonate transport system substrate-binding protein